MYVFKQWLPVCCSDVAIYGCNCFGNLSKSYANLANAHMPAARVQDTSVPSLTAASVGRSCVHANKSRVLCALPLSCG